MKNIVFLMMIASVFSCSKSQSETQTADELNGTWNLVSVTCGWCVPTDFQIGEHIWIFKPLIGEIYVSNNPDENLQILSNGNHSFIVNGSKITVLSVEYDFYFESGKLFLTDDPDADGLKLEFVRN